MLEIDKVATGENITRLMRLNHISICDLQMTLKFQSATNIYAWRRGQHTPTVDYLVKLASLFNCKIDDIIATKEAEEE